MRDRARQLEAATSEAAFTIPTERITKIFRCGPVAHAGKDAMTFCIACVSGT